VRAAGENHRSLEHGRDERHGGQKRDHLRAKRAPSETPDRCPAHLPGVSRHRGRR
jgi:hypothetical protein